MINIKFIVPTGAFLGVKRNGTDNHPEIKGVAGTVFSEPGAMLTLNGTPHL